MARRLSLSRPAVARQLRLLEEAGLIAGHRMLVDGRAVLYTLNPRRHGAITAWLAGTEVGRDATDPAAAAGIAPPPAAPADIAPGSIRGRSRQAKR